MSALPLIYAPSPRRHMLSPSYCTTYPVNNYSWKEIRPSADQHLTTHRHCQPLARRIHVINVSGCSHSAPFITFLECTSSHRPTDPSQGRCLARLRRDQCADSISIGRQSTEHHQHASSCDSDRFAYHQCQCMQ